MKTISEKHPRQVLCEFFNTAWGESHSAARVMASLLLGMYDGYRFKVDITDLRLLDEGNLRDALALMAMDARKKMEVHQCLNCIYGRHDFGMRFEHLANRWSVPGKCAKKYLEPLADVRFVVPVIKVEAA